MSIAGSKIAINDVSGGGKLAENARTWNMIVSNHVRGPMCRFLEFGLMYTFALKYFGYGSF
jgi:hypothetical protein